jgi:hypothetical protein
MAGSTDLIEILKYSVSASQVGQGFADRSAAGANADIYRTQARQALDAAAYDEAAARREGRQVIARQAAAAIAEGQGDSSAIDVIRQNEVNLIADALAVRRRGQVAAAGFTSRANAAEYEGDQALYRGIAGAGASLMTTAAEKDALERRAGAARKPRTRSSYGAKGLEID